MSIVKSFSVGNGDMFYIKHNSDNFTIIDCNLTGSNEDKKRIVDELIKESASKNLTRFISTHPDGDHFGGIEYLNSKMPIVNFYCVKNNATKEIETNDFKKYCELRDSDRAFNIYKGCSRKWMNISDETRTRSGISILWPDTSNQFYKDALKIANEGGSPNNISAMIKYGIKESVTIVWMGDVETEFMNNIEADLKLPRTDILFAPHHGRKTGKIPQSILNALDPKIIVIGEADSEYLDYYQGYNTITQNTGGDITFECVKNWVHIYCSNENYNVDFLANKKQSTFINYIGSLAV
jgi:beta-lactamase superfamily II metal-dependent hydrolase